jgi:endonuclease YncB( thermonuclease family)
MLQAEKCQETFFLLMFGLLLPLAPALAEQYVGKVVGITDGDTLTLLTPEKQQLKIRLAETNTPERNQPYGSRAREALSALAFNQQARLEPYLIRSRLPGSHLFVRAPRCNRHSGFLHD